MQQPSTTTSSDRSLHVGIVVPSIVVGLAVLMVVRQVTALLPLTARLWGINSFGYLPFWAQALLTVSSLALFLPALRQLLWTQCLTWGSDLRVFLRRMRISPTFLIALLAIPLFWVLRVRTFLLGDGQVLINDAAIVQGSSTITDLIGWSLQTRTPLSTFLYFLSAQLGQQLLHLTIPVTFQLLACLAGGLYVFAVLQWVPRVFVLPVHRVLARCLLLFHGGILLYCGYVEYYTFFHLSTTLYCLFGISALRNQTTLFWPSVFFVLSIGFHLVGVVLFPSFLLLLLARIRSPRAQTLITLNYVTSAIVASVVLFVLVYVGTGEYQLRRHFLPVQSLDVDVHYTLFSPEHLLDLVNAAVLLSSPALLAALSLTAKRIRVELLHRRDILFLLTVVVFQGLFVFLANTDLGFARDWDVTASMSVGFLLLAVLIFEHLLAKPADSSIAISLGGSALFLTIPFVIVHADETRSIDRFRDLLQMDRKVVGPDRIAYGYEMLAIHFRQRGDRTNERSSLVHALEVHDNLRFYENLMISFDRNGVREDEFNNLLAVVRRFHRELIARKADSTNLKYADHLTMYYVGLRLLREHGLCSVAQPLYEEALQEGFPRREFAYIGLGECSLIRGDTLQAVRYYNQAQAVSDLVKRDLLLMGNAYFAIGQYEHAADLYTRALAGDEQDEAALFRCALAYLHAHRRQEAQKYFLLYLERFPQGRYRDQTLSHVKSLSQ